MSALFGLNILKGFPKVAQLSAYLGELHGELCKLGQEDSIKNSETFRQTLQQLSHVKLLDHSNANVRGVCCGCVLEVIRIFAPDAPYTDNEIIHIFRGLNLELGHLNENHLGNWRPSYILHSMQTTQSCLIPIEMEARGFAGAYEVIRDLFETVISCVRSYHKLDGNSSCTTGVCMCAC